MGAQFTTTSCLQNLNPPVIDYPFSVGFWCSIDALIGTDYIAFSLGDTATTTNYLAIRKDGGEDLQLSARAGGLENNINLAENFVVGEWVHVIARFISSTSRKFSALHYNGVFEVTSGATARAPTSMNAMAIGCLRTSSFDDGWGGPIAEFFLTEGDVFVDVARDIDVEFHRQIAFGSPFSIPYVLPKILEYRSLRHGLVTADDLPGEVYSRTVQQVWTIGTGTVVLGRHPPLPYWYQKPGQQALNARRREILLPSGPSAPFVDGMFLM
jgi:hypothetical protein